MTPTDPDGEDRRLVRTIVCAYSREELPTSWLQVFHRFERTMERAGLAIRVRLAPLEELPEAFEVLVVSPELLKRAEGLRSGARVLAATRPQAQRAALELLRDLVTGSSIYAEPALPNAPRIVVRRGSEEL